MASLMLFKTVKKKNKYSKFHMEAQKNMDIQNNFEQKGQWWKDDLTRFEALLQGYSDKNNMALSQNIKIKVGM